MATGVLGERERVVNWLAAGGYWPGSYNGARNREELMAVIEDGLIVLDLSGLQAVLWIVVALGLPAS